MTFKDWAIQQHRNTNHLYDGVLPYEFHLEMVAKIGLQFQKVWYEILPNKHHNLAIYACCGHDLIEDTRVTYNDLFEVMFQNFKFEKSNATFVAEIIYALTNEKGKNRKERANDKYYEGIRSTPGAVFVKLCDRIANVKYGVMTEGKMVDKYKEENNNFLVSLGLVDENGTDLRIAIPYYPMMAYLRKLFKSDL